MLIPDDEQILEHGVFIRGPMRIQHEFLKFMAMSSRVSSRSQTLSKASSSQTEGANRMYCICNNSY